MRDYLYLWHQPSEKRLIASGIQFGDLTGDLATSDGIILLRHRFADPSFDLRTRLEYVPTSRLQQIADDNIYGYGDFCWTDFACGVSLADLSDDAIAELTFFSHMSRPLKGTVVPGLGNRFLYWAHDDGWYARIHYSTWDIMGSILRRLINSMQDEENTTSVLERIESGESAFFIWSDTVMQCEGSQDIDALQQKYLWPRSRKS